MADQSLDFRYRVRNDQAVRSSLSAIQDQLSKVAGGMDRVSRKAAQANGGVAGFLGRVARATASAGNAVEKAASGLTRATAATVGATTRMVVSAGRAGIAVNGVATALGTKLALSASAADQALTGVELALEKAAGSAQGAQEQLAFVNRLAGDLGVNFESVAQPFANLANAVGSTGASLSIAQDAFEGVIDAAQTLGVAPDKIQNALVAISQMAAKGKVSMEELSQQLGEVVPTALSTAADAMGVTQEQLIKMVSTGQVQAIPFLEKFGKALKEEYGESAKKAGDDFQSAKARLQNAIFDLKVAVARGGVTDAFKRLFDTLAKLIGAFTKTSAQDLAGVVAKRIDSFTARLERMGKVGIASFQLLLHGQEAYVKALRTLNDDGKSTVATPGSGFTSMAGALTVQDLQRYSGFASTLLKVRRIAADTFEAIVTVLRAARRAAISFFQGFASRDVFGPAGQQAKGFIAIIRLIGQKLNELAANGAFYRLGRNAAFGFNFIRTYLYALFTNTKAVVDDTARYIYSKLPFGVRQMLSAIKGALSSLGALFKALYPIIQPLVAEFAKAFGMIDVSMGMFKTGAEKAASPFLLLSMVINRNLANGKIAAFAEKGKKKMEGLIASVKLAVKVLKLLFNPSEKNDKEIVKLAPNMGQPLIDLRNVILWVIDHVKQMYVAVKLFWASWGPAIKKVIGFVTGLLDKIAPLFGLKNGKQVLLLLVFLQLIGILPIIIGMLGFIAKAVAFAFFLSSLGAIVGILGGVAAGTITWQVALLEIGKIVKGLVLGKIFGLWYTAWQALYGLFLFSKGTIVATMNTIRGAAVAVFQAIRTGSFAPIITGLKNFGAEAVRLFGAVDSYLGGWISRLWKLFFRGTGTVIKTILGGAWGLIARIGALIASSFAAAPVATVVVIGLIIAAIFALAYKFRDQIEAFFSGIGDWIRAKLVSIFGEDWGNRIANAFKALVAPIRAVWNIIMDTIDSVMTDGIGATLGKIWTKIGEIGTRIKNKVKGWFGFSVSVEDEAKGERGAQAIRSRAGYATGGPVYGAGGPRADKIAAWLSNGEYVIHSAATRWARPLLDMINFGGSAARRMLSPPRRHNMPRFANGGMVRVPNLQTAGAALRAGGIGGGMGMLSQVHLNVDGSPVLGGEPLYSVQGPRTLTKMARQNNRGARRGTPRAAR